MDDILRRTFAFEFVWVELRVLFGCIAGYRQDKLLKRKRSGSDWRSNVRLRDLQAAACVALMLSNAVAHTCSPANGQNPTGAQQTQRRNSWWAR